MRSPISLVISCAPTMTTGKSHSGFNPAVAQVMRIDGRRASIRNLTVLVPVKLVHDAMHYRGDDEARHDQKYQACIERVQSGKQLSSLRFVVGRQAPFRPGASQHSRMHGAGSCSKYS